MSNSTQTLSTPFGDIQLGRFPESQDRPDRKDPLRAWDAADEYLLDHIKDAGLAKNARILLMNDNFGALAVALQTFSPVSVSDSSVAQRGAKENLQANQLDAESVSFLTSLDALEGEFDTVLIKIPRTLALLEDELYRIQAHVNEKTLIVAGGMTRNVHNNTLDLFSKILGPVTTSLARKKARLAFCTRDASIKPGTSPYPDEYVIDTGEQEYSFQNHANVFSRSGLDVGTRLMLENLPVFEGPLDIIDLGCGNGILGVVAAVQCPQSSLRFVDESYMAIASARLNMQAAFGDSRKAGFEVNYQLDPSWDDSADLIINNPPFHHHNVNNDEVAWAMFKDSHRVLRKGGELRIVGNRHMGYHAKLKRLFGNCSTIAANAKFVILSSRK